MGDGERTVPVEGWGEAVEGFQLAGGDEQGEASGGTNQTGGGGQDGGELFDGAQSDEIALGGREGFGTGVHCIDTYRCIAGSGCIQG